MKIQYKKKENCIHDNLTNDKHILEDIWTI